MLQADDTLLYVPDPDQSGADSFEFTMSDCAFTSWRQPQHEVVTIAIVPLNDAPVVPNYHYHVQQQEIRRNTAGADVVSVDLAALVTDIDDSALRFSLVKQHGPVQAVIDGSTLRVTWSSDASSKKQGFHVTYQAADRTMAATGSIKYSPDCAVGEMLSAENETCHLCEPGYAQIMPGSTHCDRCSPGTFEDQRGSAVCRSCHPCTCVHTHVYHYTHVCAHVYSHVCTHVYTQDLRCLQRWPLFPDRLCANKLHSLPGWHDPLCRE